MFWTIADLTHTQPSADFAPAGRFVLHRHTDAQGEHLDLRLEAEGHLRGWRIDANELGEGAWATEKPPHPLRWLDDDGNATRVEAGEYAVESRSAEGLVVVLRGSTATTRVEIAPAPELPITAARAIAMALRERAIDPADAPGLLADGLAARSRAVQRLCGLGRELDADAFEESVWRKTLGRLTLDEIHQQLRAFEVRFDQKYPPQPVSRPETEGETPRSREAMAIARE